MKELGKSLYIGENKGHYHIMMEDINIHSVEEKFEAYLTMMGYIIWVLEYLLEQYYFLEYIQEHEIDAGSQSKFNLHERN